LFDYTEVDLTSYFFLVAFFTAFFGAAFFTAFLVAFLVAIVVILPFSHYEPKRNGIHQKSEKMF
jgi:hypothetical protein